VATDKGSKRSLVFLRVGTENSPVVHKAEGKPWVLVERLQLDDLRQSTADGWISGTKPARIVSTVDFGVSTFTSSPFGRCCRSP